MSLRCVSRLAAVVVLIELWMACGQYYRPVVIPLTTTPPNPSNNHAVFALSANLPGNPGAGMQIDVSGDTDVGEFSYPSLIPTHAAVAPNNTRLYVASSGSLLPGGVGADTVAFVTPVSVLGGSLAPIVVSLPSGSLPDFVATTETGFVYVANFGTNSVIQINANNNQVVNSAPVGTNPVAMAETPVSTPNPTKLYVANQGSNSVTSLNTSNLSQNPVSGFSGLSPVWVAARGDGQKVYVLTQGDGQLVTIDTATDTVTGSLSVGGGANFVFYDPNLNRLYVTNPVTGTVFVFSDTGGTNDTPTQLLAFCMTSMTPVTSTPCPTGISPASVAALPDGSRFYVASYQTAATCPDPNVAGSCVIPQLTVFDGEDPCRVAVERSSVRGDAVCRTTGVVLCNQYSLHPGGDSLPDLYRRVAGWQSRLRRDVRRRLDRYHQHHG
jgi:YVTN family beta-propeller protein